MINRYRMAIKTYLVSCLVLLANCNVHAICNVGCDDVQSGNTGYFASGSAHSSQYVLPSGEVVTHSKGNSYSSDGIKKTFEQLKREANQFVQKQTDHLNIPNALPPLHSSFGQDLQNLQSFGDIGYQPQGYFNQLESGSHQQQIQSSGGSASSQGYYSVQPQASKITSTKKEQVQVNKKVITHGSNSYGTSGLEEFETSQNGLDSNLNSESFGYRPIPSYTGNVQVQSGNKQEEIETIHSNAQLRPVIVQKIQIPSQTQTFSKYEQRVKHNASSQIVPGIPAYIPNGQFTTGVLNLNPVVSNKVATPVKYSVPSAVEQHYSNNEESESSIHEDIGSSFNSEVNTHQQEHKYDAIPVASKPVVDVPFKIKYTYDGKTLRKYEVYTSGVEKEIPMSVEEHDSILKEIQQQTTSHATQSYNISPQPVSHEKPESDGYYYYPKPSNVQTFKKEQTQSSHSHQTIANGNVEQFSHLPLNVNSQKQYYTQQAGYQGVIPPAASQISYEGSESTGSFNSQNPAILLGGVPQLIPVQSQHSKLNYEGSEAVDAFNAQNPAILVGGAPQLIPVQSQHSSSSGSTFHSSSYTGGSSTGGFVFPSDSLASSQTSTNVFDKLSSLNTSGSKLLNCGDCLTTGASGVPVKNSYGVSTSFSSSSSNINGKKTENRQASIAVNDNGKVDTYNVKS